MFSEPNTLILAAAMLGLIATLFFSRFVGAGKLAVVAIVGPVLLFIALPLLNIPLGKTEVLGAGAPGLLLLAGGAICLAATVAGVRKDA